MVFMAVQALSAPANGGYEVFSSPPLFSKKAVKTAFHAVENYQLAYQRARTLHANRSVHTERSGKPARWDGLLLNPIQYRSKAMRALAKGAVLLEEIGEASADVSSMIERFTRHCISGGDKTDLAKIAAAGTGRVLSSQITFGSAGVNKLIACGCLATSGLLSLLVISMADTRFGKLRTEREIQRAILNGESIRPELYPQVARNLERIKKSALNKIELWSKPCGKQICRKIQFLKERLSRNNSDKIRPASDRRQGTNYMWNNRHQYSRFVRGMLHAANLIFTVVNKTFCSYDKHMGVLLGQKVLAKRIGSVLGTRLGLTLMYGVAAVAAHYLSIAGFSLSTLGPCACGLAFLLVLLAKAHVAMGGGWVGDCKKPIQSFRPLAK